MSYEQNMVRTNTSVVKILIHFLRFLCCFQLLGFTMNYIIFNPKNTEIRM